MPTAAATATTATTATITTTTIATTSSSSSPPPLLLHHHHRDGARAPDRRYEQHRTDGIPFHSWYDWLHKVYLQAHLQATWNSAAKLQATAAKLAATSKPLSTATAAARAGAGAGGAASKVSPKTLESQAARIRNLFRNARP